MNLLTKTGIPLVVILASLVLAGCPRARISGASGTVTVTCPPGARCTRTVSGTVTVTFPFNEFNSHEDYAAILDLSNEWIAVDVPSTSAKLKLISSTGGFVEQEFEMVRVASSVASVDKDTTPTVFEYADPASVDAFFETNSAYLTGNDDIVEMTLVTSIQRSSCQTPTGKYPTHIRYLDSSGITFFTTLQFNYTEPEIFHQGCDEGDLQIEY